ncbi:MAG: tetratricopeptide repeat protein, partial [Notoacmeibacter sp.]|nr:tetratricopeptide repeat protein [Notoacmeibacter sp.]
DQVRDRLDFKFEDMGGQEVKNIDRPVQVWKWSDEGSDKPKSKKLQVHDNPSIAVLPFDNMSGDVEQDYFADGIVETITAALARIRSFFVIARNTSFTYKGRSMNVISIGKELGVAYVLEGSVQRLGNRVRITAQLIETEAGNHVWAERYDGTVDDLFDLQDRITEQVVGALQPTIRLAEIERVRRKRSNDVGAYDYTMRAMPHVWALEKEESAKALELLEQALKIDPDYPLALTLAGWCHEQRSVYYWSDDVEKSQAEAQRLAEKAVEFGGDDPLILAVLGAVHTFVRNLGTARILLERAVAQDPNSAWAWTRLGWLEVYSDRPETGLKHFEHSLRLSPMDPMNFNNYAGIASAHEVAQEYDLAVKFFRRVLEERPNAGWVYRNLTASLSGAGHIEEARESFQKMMEIYPDMTCAKYAQVMIFSPDAVKRTIVNLKRLGLPD